MKGRTKIVVVLTCHNRKEKTLNCLKRLHESAECSRETIDVQYVVCDDASTDGTAESIQQTYPNVSLVSGDGDLFWAKGMAMAMSVAEQKQADFYLMVNDDVIFESNVFDIMMNSYRLANEEMSAIVGSTCNEKGEHTYGGIIWNGKTVGKKSERVIPNGKIQFCNQTNWNCFLIPVKLYNKVGKIDSYYEHSAADYDYSNRIVRAGYKIYVAEQYIGKCEKNDIRNTWRDNALTLHERIKLLHKKTGVPVKSNWYYCRKYHGIWAPYEFAKPYIGIFCSAIKGK